MLQKTKITAATTVMFSFILLMLMPGAATAQTDTASQPADSTIILYNKAASYFEAGKTDSSLISSKQMEEYTARKTGLVSRQYMIALYTTGEIYRLMNDYQQAFHSYQQSLSVLHSLPLPNDPLDIPYFGLLEGRIGHTAAELGAYSEAKRWLKDVLKMEPQKKTFQDDFPLLMQLAEVYLSEGDYVRADSIYIKYLTDVKTIQRGDTLHYQQAAVYNNQALMYNSIGNPKKAMELLQRSVKLNKQLRQHAVPLNDFVEVLLNLEDLYLQQHQVNKAIPALKEAEDSLDIQNKYLLALLLKAKSGMAKYQLHYNEAIAYYTEYQKTMDELSYKRADYFIALADLFDVYSIAGKFTLADSLFLNQKNYLQQHGMELSTAMAITQMNYCNNLYRQARYQDAAKSLASLIRLTFQGMNANFIGLPEADKLLYKKKLNEMFDLLYTCLLHKDSIDKGIIKDAFLLEIQRQGWVLNYQSDLLNSLRQSPDSAIQKQFSLWLNNRQILARQTSLPMNERMLNTDSLAQKTDELEKELYLIAGRKKDDAKKEVISQAADLKMPADVRLLIVQFNESVTADKPVIRYAALLQQKNADVPIFIPLCKEKQLLEILKDSKGRPKRKEQLTAEIYYAGGQSALKLYRLLWQPLQQSIPINSHIAYACSGLLNDIAFPAIYDGRQYLVNRYTFTRFFNLNAAENDDEVKLPLQISIWGNINYNATRSSRDLVQKQKSDIPNAEPDRDRMKNSGGSKGFSKAPLESLAVNEPAIIARILNNGNANVKIYQGSLASEDNFKMQAPEVNGIIHISTHGFYSPRNIKYTNDPYPSGYISQTSNPLLRCGLAFAGVNYYWLKGKSLPGLEDGILSGYEIAQLNLQNVKLVVLSACETGLGDISDTEGNIGLQRAFKLAGVGYVLVSLWKVPEVQTTRLFSYFYKYLRNGMQVSVALKQAQTQMAKKYPPFYWGGFILVK